MKLTTEQKINMLILAGYEPRKWTYGNEYSWRLIHNVGLLYVEEHQAANAWRFELYNEPTAWPASYVTVEWADVAGYIHRCPDELIYEAIEATTG